jgi:two-component system CheB/CheR fusion protein
MDRVAGIALPKVGEHLLNLDSGLPVEHLKPLLREVMFDGSARGQVVVSAVNRRGRSVQLRVSASPLASESDEPTGALLLMEPLDSAGD